MRAKKSLITYDIDLDFKILNILVAEKNKSATITTLRTYLEIHSSRLQEHIEYLVSWNILKDKKPERNGKARIISFANDYDDCIADLVELKDAIDVVNEHFSK